MPIRLIVRGMVFAGWVYEGTFRGTVFCNAQKNCRIPPLNSLIRLLFLLWSYMVIYGRARDSDKRNALAPPHQNYTIPSLLVFGNAKH